jgi:hypothetical protein
MKKNLKALIGVVIAGVCITGLTAAGADSIKLGARSGSKIRMEGTSNIHDWQSVATLIGGTLEVGPNFPITPGQNVPAGKVECKGQAWVVVNSFRSVEKDGKPYSDKMDEVMYDHLKKDTNPRIIYSIEELSLKEAPKTKDAPYVFESKGELAVAGVTNKVTMPVNVTPLGDEGKRIKIAGTTELKMSDFKISPPSPPLVGTLIKTGDPVKVSFEWFVAPTKPADTAAK